jgi:hypothetical protein
MELKTGSKNVVCNVWSDEAREAAAEARRSHATGGDAAPPSDAYSLAARARTASKSVRDAAGHIAAAKAHQEAAAAFRAEHRKHKEAAKKGDTTALYHAEGAKTRMEEHEETARQHKDLARQLKEGVY